MNGQNNNLEQQYKINQMDELDWIQYRRKETRRMLDQSRKRLRTQYDGLTQKDKIPSDKWGKTAYILSKSGTIINGLRIGLTIGKTINMLAKIRRTFSKR